MKKERLPPVPEPHQAIRPRHEEDHAASKGDLRNAHRQMNAPSRDWTKLANILRRACGGFSRSRTAHHGSRGSKPHEK
ncbi:hypothetical protein Brsp05_04357 [Brucella sp. NBRC 12953]